MNGLKTIFKTVRRESPILYAAVLLHFVTALACLIGWMVDDRMLLGVSVWVKPLKFTISGGIYLLTSGYLITLYPFSKRKRNIINNITTWAMIFDVGIIVLQAARGVRSHYNQETLLDGLLFAAMGILIVVIVFIMLVFIVETVRLRLNTPRPIQWGILLGWLIVLLGSWAGGQMIGQMSHSVGVADGGDGLPFLNWSTLAGDIRVAHFFGLHGIQIIPLFAYLVHKKVKTNTLTKNILVILFGLLYAGWIAFTFYQAKQGMPLVRV